MTRSRRYRAAVSLIASLGLAFLSCRPRDAGQVNRDRPERTGPAATEDDSALAEIRRYQRELDLAPAGDPESRARALRKLGAAHGRRGDFSQQARHYGLALPIVRKLGDHDSEVELLNDQGKAYRRLGEDDLALEAYGRALELAQREQLSSGEASALNNIAVILQPGEPLQALKLYHQALPVWRRLGKRDYEAVTLHNIGLTYSRLGRLDDALGHLETALELPTVAGSGYSRAATLTELGRVLDRQGQGDRAIESFQAALALQPSAADRGAALDGLGTALWRLGRMPEALRAYRDALEIYRGLGMEAFAADIEANIGRLHHAWGRPEEALEHSRRAIRTFEASGNLPGKAHALVISARAEIDRRNLAAARSLIEQALEIVELFRGLPDSLHLRSRFFADRQDYYELYIDLLMRLHGLEPEAGYDVLAFEASEQSRARSFLEELGEARLDLSRGADPALADRLRWVSWRLNAKDRQLRRLGTPGQEHAEDSRELRRLAAERDRLQAEIRSAHPDYFDRAPPEILTARQIRERLLDDDTLLLRYSLGAERSYLWLLSLDSLTSHTLAGRAEIEQLARTAYDLFTRSHKPEVGAQFRLAAAMLSDLLLAPVARRLDRRRLLVIADGALQYIPFAALPLPAAEEPAVGPLEEPGSRPLILDFQVTRLPSASVTAQLERRLEDRPPAPELLAMFADPVFGTRDPRFRSPPSTPAAAEPGTSERTADLETAASDLGLDGFERLPFSGREAEAILGLVTADSDSATYLGFDAAKDRLLGADLGRYRILHFATHGVLHPGHPELSGLVLSGIDRRGRPRDGFLRAHEIFSLELSAELVVLSACRTALGRELRGEGLLGLARGFMYAGAGRVLVTLWSVDDESAAVVMERFYRGLIEDAQGPAAALRAAQLSLLHDRRWRAPYYWAGYSLLGKSGVQAGSNKSPPTVSIGPEPTTTDVRP